MQDISNGKAEYYTGNRSKQLLVHIMQDGVEVDKPIKSRIYEHSVTWNKRQWAIIPQLFYYDHKGVAHQQVDVNTMSVLHYRKLHTDTCKKCNGKMDIDTQMARSLGRRGIFNAIWGLDSTHMILILIFAIAAIGTAVAFMWAYNDATVTKVKLENANKEVARLNGIINPEPPANTGGHIINEGKP